MYYLIAANEDELSLNCSRISVLLYSYLNLSDKEPTPALSTTGLLFSSLADPYYYLLFKVFKMM
jgi:hypothetical protein